MTDFTLPTRQEQVDAFDFRTVHPNLRFGTASDRYAGWIGQVYPDHFTEQVQKRRRKLGKETFEEHTLPITSVVDYFQHFGVLELDFTFYRPLLEKDGHPSSNLYVLEQYADHAPEEAVFLLKAPQDFFSRTLRRSRDGRVIYEDNPDFLNAEAYTRRFHEPAVSLLGERFGGVLFEQAYQRRKDSPAPEVNIAELDGFFRAIPNDVQPHLELRSPHLLIPPYFDWLETLGLGFVFSHWTWLPPLREQWALCGGRFTAGDGNAVARLLTPLNMKYETAYAHAHPFDQPVPELCETRQARDMVLDVVALTFQAEEQDAQLNLIANNRAWGNAPSLAQAIGRRILNEEERRSQDRP